MYSRFKDAREYQWELYLQRVITLELYYYNIMSKLCFESDFEALLDYIEDKIPTITIRACPGIEQSHIYASNVEDTVFEETVEQGINALGLNYTASVERATEEDLYDMKAILTH